MINPLRVYWSKRLSDHGFIQAQRVYRSDIRVSYSTIL